MADQDVEEALARLQQRLDDIQRLTGMGDFVMDTTTYEMWWSDQHFRIYGFEPGSIAPTTDTAVEMTHPDDRADLLSVGLRALQSGEPYQVVGRIVRADGEVRHLVTTAQVVADDDGTPTRIIGTTHDITERVLAEQEHEKSRQTLHLELQRRTQAVEINDTVLQGISAAGYALELGQLRQCATYLQETLEAARRMVADLMGDEGDGDAVPLTRSAPAHLGAGSGSDPHD